MPIMPSFPNQSHSFRGTTSFEQGSGVVVVNNKNWLLGMMATCKMNSKLGESYGRTETFWIEFEMIQDPYAFVRSTGSVIGEVRYIAITMVCGFLLQLDYLERPMADENKGRNIEWGLDYGYWVHGGGMQQQREFFVNKLDKQLELLDDLELHSMDELQRDPKDTEWLEHFSCLGHKPAVKIG
ncbi:hypothetical protein BG006_011121 [Podila minutissima]|uniref:Uncharacterized protein n=1 Tax=Podila minutissima TaxID=64525 RepID=A0A9P5SQN7_9FUNG|nr:hypothetical protein BG006_011121 [Podila minutissima]